MFDILIRAIKYNNLCLIKEILQDNQSYINMADDNGNCIIHYVCYYNQFDILKWLYYLPNINIMKRDNNGNRPLDIACKYNYYNIIYLLANSITTNEYIYLNESITDEIIQDNYKCTLLHIYVMKNDINIVSILAVHDNGSKNIYGRTALFLACIIENKTMIDLLNNRYVNIPDMNGETPLIWACINNKPNIVFKLLLNPHTKINKLYKKHPAIYYASQLQETTCLEMFIAILPVDREIKLKHPLIDCRNNDIHYRRILREKFKLENNIGVDIFALIILFSDNYLKLTCFNKINDFQVIIYRGKYGIYYNFDDHSKIVSFLNICSKLPIELLMSICNSIRLETINKVNISASDIEYSLKTIIKMFNK